VSVFDKLDHSDRHIYKNDFSIFVMSDYLSEMAKDDCFVISIVV